jgi:hypothetical protein
MRSKTALPPKFEHSIDGSSTQIWVLNWKWILVLKFEYESDLVLKFASTRLVENETLVLKFEY